MASALLDRFLNNDGSSYPSDFQNILNLMAGSKSIGPTSEKFIWKAYSFGKEAHKGQLRKSGEPYFTVNLLAEEGLLLNIYIIS